MSFRCRTLFLSALCTAATITGAVQDVYAADAQPIERKYDSAQIMDRVQLVGVIAGGASANAGIALIKDAHTGRTYVIKTGDNLPGVGHIKLHKVQRELAVFESEGKEFHVRLSLNATTTNVPALTEKTKQHDNDDQMDDEVNGPGLFEKWYGNNLGASLSDLEDSSKSRDKSQTSSDDSGSTTKKGQTIETDQASQLNEKSRNENSRNESSANDGRTSENATNSYE